MNIKVIAFGHTGVTLKAGQMLAKNLDGAEIIDGRTKFDLTDADAYVLGTNVHFGKFNKRFIKFIKKIKGAKVFLYICGAEIERSGYYIDKAREILPDALDIKYVWGELNSNGQPFLRRFAIDSFIDGRKKDGLPRPQIMEKEILSLRQSIKEMLN